MPCKIIVLSCLFKCLKIFIMKSEIVVRLEREEEGGEGLNGMGANLIDLAKPKDQISFSPYLSASP